MSTITEPSVGWGSRAARCASELDVVVRRSQGRPVQRPQRRVRAPDVHPVAVRAEGGHARPRVRTRASWPPRRLSRRSTALRYPSSPLDSSQRASGDQMKSVSRGGDRARGPAAGPGVLEPQSCRSPPGPPCGRPARGATRGSPARSIALVSSPRVSSRLAPLTSQASRRPSPPRRVHGPVVGAEGSTAQAVATDEPMQQGTRGGIPDDRGAVVRRRHQESPVVGVADLADVSRVRPQRVAADLQGRGVEPQDLAPGRDGERRAVGADVEEVRRPIAGD